MKILHYTLGFPPERTGGLVKYSLDLMNEQLKQGNQVLLMYPGRINLLKRKPYFKFGRRNNIFYAELINSLPLPLIGNIETPKDFMQNVDPAVFESFLKKIKPDIIHIHTLMGLYLEFFEVAKKLKIKILFTTHDYFGISPHPKFYLDGHDFIDDGKYDIWNNIRSYGSKTQKLRMVQLSVYPILRSILKKIKKRSIVNSVSERVEWSNNVDVEFQRLKKYYREMLGYVNIVHFNSSVARDVYKKFLPEMDWAEYVLGISSTNINKFGKIRIQKSTIKTIAYIGPYTIEKGFYDYVNYSKKFIAHDSENKALIMGDDRNVQYTNIKNLGKYDKSSLIKYLKQVDLVILPSQWHETFGLIAVEVLSTGTPVLITKKMGVRDIVPANLQVSCIENLTDEVLKQSKYNGFIEITSMEEHAISMYKLYKHYNLK